MSSLLVTLDGVVLDRETPFLRADDLGVVRGDGVFEGLLVQAGIVDGFDEHMARLGRSADRLGIPVPSAESWRTCLKAAMASWDGGEEMAVRLIVTRGVAGGVPTAYLLAEEVSALVMAQRRDGVSALTLLDSRDPVLRETAPWLLIGAKTLSYAVNMAATRWANDHGADDAIFVTRDGQVLEAPTASVLAVSGKSMWSPPPADGILDGITVAALLDRASRSGWSASFRTTTVDELIEVDGVWLISSIRRAVAIHTLDGHRVTVDAGLDDRVSRLASPSLLEKQ